MGETGCGKTHLIRFMCQFARYNNPDIQNMFILKVKGQSFSDNDSFLSAKLTNYRSMVEQLNQRL